MIERTRNSDHRHFAAFGFHLRQQRRFLPRCPLTPPLNPRHDLYICQTRLLLELRKATPADENLGDFGRHFYTWLTRRLLNCEHLIDQTEDVATALLGQPIVRTRREIRFGSKNGSLSALPDGGMHDAETPAFVQTTIKGLTAQLRGCGRPGID
jgi:hypothetical protein